MSQATATLYDSDFYAWTQEQANLLRQKAYGQLDLTNLIEEIEDMGKSQQRELSSRLVVLLVHLLKWHFQPEKQSRSWQATIRVQRRELLKLLNENPSLRPRLDWAISESYPVALDTAWAETGLDYIVFPSACPYSGEQILDQDFLPVS